MNMIAGFPESTDSMYIIISGELYWEGNKYLYLIALLNSNIHEEVSEHILAK
jgi:hypothetical protein